MGKENYARLVLQKAYKIDSSSSTVIFNLGCLYKAMGNLEKAADFFRQYSKAKPGNPFIKDFLENYSSQEKKEKPHKEEKEEEKKSSLRDLIDESFSRKKEDDQAFLQTMVPDNPEEIISKFSKKTSPLPEDTPAILQAIFESHKEKNHERAFELLSGLKINEVTRQEEKAKLAKILSSLGSKKHKEEKHLQAVKCYKDALLLNPNLPLQAKIGQQYFKAGEKFLSQHLSDEAIESFVMALEWDKGSPAKKILIQSLTEKSKEIIEEKGIEPACDLLRRILELEPDNEWAILKLKEGGKDVHPPPRTTKKLPAHKKEEVEVEEKILSEIEEEPEVTLEKEKKDLEKKKKGLDKEKEDLEKEEKSREKEKKGQEKEKKGQEKEKKGQEKEKKAPSKKPFSPLAIAGILSIVIGLPLVIFLIYYFITNTGIDARERQADSYFYKGLNAEKEGNLEEAVILFEKAIEFNPSYAEAYNHLGQAYDRQGEYTKAIKAFETAKNNNLNYAAVYDNLALISQKMGDGLNAGIYYELAVEKYNLKTQFVREFLESYSKNETIKATEKLLSAISIDPEDPTLYYNLGLTYIRDGNIDGAKKALEKAIKISESRDRADYVEKFSYVLSNIESEDLVLDIIAYDAPPEPTVQPEETPSASAEETPAADNTKAPEATATPVPTVPPMPDEDPQVAAVDSISLFFQCLNDKNYKQAYSLLSDERQSERDVSDFASGFSDISSLNVSSIRIIETTDTSISVKVYFTAHKEGQGGSYLGAFQGIYTLIWQGRGWKIDYSEVEEKTLEGQDDTDSF